MTWFSRAPSINASPVRGKVFERVEPVEPIDFEPGDLVGRRQPNIYRDPAATILFKP